MLAILKAIPYIKTLPDLLKPGVIVGDPWKDTKGLWRSKTVWAALLPVLVWAADKFGWNLDDAGAQEVLEQAALIVGAVGVILGRIDADKPTAKRVVK